MVVLLSLLIEGLSSFTRKILLMPIEAIVAGAIEDELIGL